VGGNVLALSRGYLNREERRRKLPFRGVTSKGGIGKKVRNPLGWNQGKEKKEVNVVTGLPSPHRKRRRKGEKQQQLSSMKKRTAIAVRGEEGGKPLN